jgi:hypothetical protein
MLKRITHLIFALAPFSASAEAAICKIDQATFRPKYAMEHFALRGHRDDNDLLFGLAIQKTGETFSFKVNVDERTGEGRIASVPDSSGRDLGISATFRLLDANGLKVSSLGEVGQISFADIGRAFLDFRLREGRQPEPYTFPSSGIWKLTECAE